MISDLYAAQLCQAIYSPSAGAFNHILDVSGVVGGIKYVGGDTVVALRGSITVQDWLRDLKIWPEYDAQLGFVADGFTDGVAAFIVALKPLIKGNLILCGHSLGAARACIIAAMIPSVQLVLFGCPRVSIGNKIRKLIAFSGTKSSSYRNWSDLVIAVPSRWLMYRHSVCVTQVRCNPEPENDIVAHEIALYVEALMVG